VALESKLLLSDWLKNCVFILLDIASIEVFFLVKSDCDNIAIFVAVWLEAFCCMEFSKNFVADNWC